MNPFEKFLVLVVSFFLATSAAAYLVSQPDTLLVILGVLVLVAWALVVVRYFIHAFADSTCAANGEPPRRMPTVPPSIRKPIHPAHPLPLNTVVRVAGQLCVITRVIGETENNPIRYIVGSHDGKSFTVDCMWIFRDRLDEIYEVHPSHLQAQTGL